MTDLEEKLSEQSHFGSRLRQGEPILLAGDYTSRLVGFSMNSVSEGEIAHVRARAALTSDAQLFHKVVESLEGVITPIRKRLCCQQRTSRKHTSSPWKPVR